MWLCDSDSLSLSFKMQMTQWLVPYISFKFLGSSSAYREAIISQPAVHFKANDVHITSVKMKTF